MKKKYFIYLVLFLTSCDTYDFIDIINECNSEIVTDYSLDKSPTFPSINRTAFYLNNSINKGESQRLTKFGANGWERYIKEGNNNILNVFIYQVDSIRKYGSIDSLKAKGLFRRLEFTVEELETINYDIYLCKEE